MLKATYFLCLYFEFCNCLDVVNWKKKKIYSGVVFVQWKTCFKLLHDYNVVMAVLCVGYNGHSKMLQCHYYGYSRHVLVIIMPSVEMITI